MSWLCQNQQTRPFGGPIGRVRIKPMVYKATSIVPLGADREVHARRHTFKTPGAIIEPASNRFHFTGTHWALDIVISNEVKRHKLFAINDHVTISTALSILTTPFNVDALTDETPFWGLRGKLTRSNKGVVRDIGKSS